VILAAIRAPTLAAAKLLANRRAKPKRRAAIRARIRAAILAVIRAAARACCTASAPGCTSAANAPAAIRAAILAANRSAIPAAAATKLTHDETRSATISVRVLDILNQATNGPPAKSGRAVVVFAGNENRHFHG
jgi:hypothetical protein